MKYHTVCCENKEQVISNRIIQAARYGWEFAFICTLPDGRVRIDFERNQAAASGDAETEAT